VQAFYKLPDRVYSIAQYSLREVLPRRPCISLVFDGSVYNSSALSISSNLILGQLPMVSELEIIIFEIYSIHCFTLKCVILYFYSKIYIISCYITINHTYSSMKIIDFEHNMFIQLNNLFKVIVCPKKQSGTQFS
jgi:hypothetical protein